MIAQRLSHPNLARRGGFVLIGVVLLFAAIAAMMMALSTLEAHAARRVAYWGQQGRLDALTQSAAVWARFQLLEKGQPNKGTYETGDPAIKTDWSIESLGNDQFLIKAHSRTPASGSIKWQSETVQRFARKLDKENAVLKPISP